MVDLKVKERVKKIAKPILDKLKLTEHVKKLRGQNRLDFLENICIIFIIGGAVILSIGMGSTALSPKGLTAVTAMMGAVISFSSTVALVFVWLAKEFKQ
ncbi:MAG TPA: hypothetical protein VJH34_04530 [archaeon]|nr:hypothetical protein [archaeon]